MAGIPIEVRGGIGVDRLRHQDPYNIPALRQEAQRLGFEFVYYPETTSTMHIVEGMVLEEGIRKPIIALADHQTGGIGRDARVWHDKPGASVLMSTLLNLGDREEIVGLLADRVALLTADAVSEVTGKFAQIKYPNDIVLNGAKTAGILVKNIYDGDNYLGTNVGIGINLHYTPQEVRQIPSDYGATSLDAATRAFNNRGQLLVALMKGLRWAANDARHLADNKSYRDTLNALWRESSFVLGREVYILDGDQVIVQGKVTDAAMGEGIEVDNPEVKKWFNLFGSNMKVRVV